MWLTPPSEPSIGNILWISYDWVLHWMNHNTHPSCLRVLVSLWPLNLWVFHIHAQNWCLVVTATRYAKIFLDSFHEISCNIFHFLCLFSPRIFYYTCIHNDMHTYSFSRSCVPLESLLLVLSPFVTLLVIKSECTISPILTYIIQEDSNNKQKGSKGRETEKRPPVLGQT
jgi:hypothetical protein